MSSVVNNSLENSLFRDSLEIHLLSKILLYNYRVSGAVLNAGVTAKNKHTKKSRVCFQFAKFNKI